MMFKIYDQEKKLMDGWLEEHDKDCEFSDPTKCGAIGGRLTFRFTPTSLGCITTVTCACGEECDLTNYDW